MAVQRGIRAGAGRCDGRTHRRSPAATTLVGGSVSAASIAQHRRGSRGWRRCQNGGSSMCMYNIKPARRRGGAQPPVPENGKRGVACTALISICKEAVQGASAQARYSTAEGAAPTTTPKGDVLPTCGSATAVPFEEILGRERCCRRTSKRGHAPAYLHEAHTRKSITRQSRYSRRGPTYSSPTRAGYAMGDSPVSDLYEWGHWGCRACRAPLCRAPPEARRDGAGSCFPPRLGGAPQKIGVRASGIGCSRRRAAGARQRPGTRLVPLVPHEAGA